MYDEINEFEIDRDYEPLHRRFHCTNFYCVKMENETCSNSCCYNCECFLNCLCCSNCLNCSNE